MSQSDEILTEGSTVTLEVKDIDSPPPVKRGPGRPPGSKNKKKPSDKPEDKKEKDLSRGDIERQQVIDDGLAEMRGSRGPSERDPSPKQNAFWWLIRW